MACIACREFTSCIDVVLMDGLTLHHIFYGPGQPYCMCEPCFEIWDGEAILYHPDYEFADGVVYEFSNEVEEVPSTPDIIDEVGAEEISNLA